MFNNYLGSIKGVEIFPIISLVIFFIFFIVLAYMVIKADKKFISKMESMPLDSAVDKFNNDIDNNQRV
jgi:hypothetical protein